MRKLILSLLLCSGRHTYTADVLELLWVVLTAGLEFASMVFVAGFVGLECSGRIRPGVAAPAQAALRWASRGPRGPHLISA